MYKRLNCDFYFGDSLKENIKSFDPKTLGGFKGLLRNVYILGEFYYWSGMLSKVFKYKTFIVEGEPYGLSTWFFLISARILSKDVYVWSHGWYGRESLIKKMIKKIFFNLSKSVLLYGDYARDLMKLNGFPDNKLVSIYNSLDYDKHKFIRKTLCKTDILEKLFNNDLPTVIYVGRIQKRKRIDLLIESIKQLNANKPIINLLIVGANSNAFEFSEYSENILFYGPCYDEEYLAHLFYNSAVCVTPGDIGLTAIHSMSFGTPVITHNNFMIQGPEFESIIEGETGSFYEFGNVDSLKSVIFKLANLDDAMRDQVRRNCFDMVDRRYNPYNQIDILCKVLRKNEYSSN